MNTNSSARPARPLRQPYEAPEVLALGHLRALTRGPVKDMDKNMDQLFGGSGGFVRRDGGLS